MFVGLLFTKQLPASIHLSQLKQVKQMNDPHEVGSLKKESWNWTKGRLILVVIFTV